MNRKRTLGIILVALVQLPACTVGPDYRPPVPPAGAAAPLVSLNPAVETTESAPDAWWHLYDDPQLNKFIQQALVANADLAAAEANLAGARALLEAARNGQYPQTTTQAGGIYGRDVTTDEILELGGRKPEDIWLFDDILDVSYEIDLFGRVRRSIEASHADAEAAAAARDSVKITVVAETTRAYAQICTLGEQIAVARRSLELVARQGEITAQRRQAGAGTEFDVVRAQGLTANTRAAIAPLEGQRRAALFELADLLGVTPSHAPIETLTCLQPPRLNSLIPVGDGAALLARRPDVHLADRRFAAATARIGVATADLYPRISLTGFFGGAATDLSGLTENRGLAWGVGPTLSWSFPNQAGVRARIHAAKADADSDLAEFDATVLQALKETETSLAVYSTELDHHEALTDAQDKASRAFDMARGQYLAGSVSTLDLLTSEQSLVLANASVAASDGALVADQIAVFKALGGGWQSRPD